MGHPSNRTLVRVLRLGGAKRRFILAPARHKCGACEAQKRPAGPIVSRSPTAAAAASDSTGLDRVVVAVGVGTGMWLTAATFA